jgi:hypothetical protein
MTKHLYIKKPIPVEAYQWFETNGDNFVPAPDFEPVIRQFEGVWKIHTAEGWMIPVPGSFIVKGPGGEYWPVREDYFLNTYSAVPQEDFDQRPKKCSARIWAEGGTAPRTCQVCQLGPCRTAG